MYIHLLSTRPQPRGPTAANCGLRTVLSRLPFRPVGGVFNCDSLRLDLRPDSIRFSELPAEASFFPSGNPLLHPLCQLRIGANRLGNYIEHGINTRENAACGFQRALVDAVSIELGVG